MKKRIYILTILVLTSFNLFSQEEKNENKDSIMFCDILTLQPDPFDNFAFYNLINEKLRTEPILTILKELHLYNFKIFAYGEININEEDKKCELTFEILKILGTPNLNQEEINLLEEKYKEIILELGQTIEINKVIEQNCNPFTFQLTSRKCR